MLQTRHNMFFVCVTVGIVLLASKYRSNVLRSVKHFCRGIRIKRSSVNCKKDQMFSEENIILADSPEKCDYAIQHIHRNLSNSILGLDCEWASEGPVSLLQLATCNGVCALFRLNKIGYIPSKVKELLANRRVLKVGVAALEDGHKLTKDYGCRVRGTLDLRILAERLELPNPKSLAALCLEYLHLELDKLVEVRCSDWNADALTEEQMSYAAYDAIASVLIYQQIIQRSKRKQSLWQKCMNQVKVLWNSDKDERYHGLPSGTIDTSFRFKNPHNSDTTAKKVANINQVLNKINNSSLKTSLPTRIKPLYHNCYLQAPDGETLCTCDRKKAEWYVMKSLGDVVDEDPYTVRLKFEPSGRALGEVGQYYTQVKLNQCVVCGSTDKFIRKNVVPREYRKYFPLVMKAHQSHDVLLMCPPCHEISNMHDVQLRKKLAEMCNAPFPGPLTQRDHVLNERRKLDSAVKALQRSNMLPQRRRKDLEDFILECTGQREITIPLLNALSADLRKNLSASAVCDEQKCQPHGLKVVQYFQEREGGLVELERLWREHFLTTMKPQHMPKLWSISHNQERLIIRQTQNRIDVQDAKVAGLVN